MKRGGAASAVLLLGLGLGLVMSACSSGGSSGGRPVAGTDFFDHYVAADGRVVRHDQGGDTVSEGQAYALLLAARQGDHAAFHRVWRWTRGELQQRDGLFAWHWRDGRVIDT